MGYPLRSREKRQSNVLVSSAVLTCGDCDAWPLIGLLLPDFATSHTVIWLATSPMETGVVSSILDVHPKPDKTPWFLRHGTQKSSQPNAPPRNLRPPARPVQGIAGDTRTGHSPRLPILVVIRWPQSCPRPNTYRRLKGGGICCWFLSNESCGMAGRVGRCTPCLWATVVPECALGANDRRLSGDWSPLSQRMLPKVSKLLRQRADRRTWSKLDVRRRSKHLDARIFLLLCRETRWNRRRMIHHVDIVLHVYPPQTTSSVPQSPRVVLLVLESHRPWLEVMAVNQLARGDHLYRRQRPIERLLVTRGPWDAAVEMKEAA
ncbi:hypothetical protein TCAP_02006 [Tolypocladium capitatum]|uniref:Uncharacterized protein n=1 Tax=Tolypocladium capitatum TaxID=45235 RepID=A0A2K3QKM6_9HYPO|nr:hypothetical protein TCAP_02006 [Tolypocladium capitatum]